MGLRLTKNLYDGFIAEGTVLVSFTRGDDRDCKAVDHALTELTRRLPDVPIGVVNVDVDRDLAVQHRIRSLPSVVLYIDGQQKGLLAGRVSSDRLEHWVCERLDPPRLPTTL